MPRQLLFVQKNITLAQVIRLPRHHVSPALPLYERERASFEALAKDDRTWLRRRFVWARLTIANGDCADAAGGRHAPNPGPLDRPILAANSGASRGTVPARAWPERSSAWRSYGFAWRRHESFCDASCRLAATGCFIRVRHPVGRRRMNFSRGKGVPFTLAGESPFTLAGKVAHHLAGKVAHHFGWQDRARRRAALWSARVFRLAGAVQGSQSVASDVGVWRARAWKGWLAATSSSWPPRLRAVRAKTARGGCQGKMGAAHRRADVGAIEETTAGAGSGSNTGVAACAMMAPLCAEAYLGPGPGWWSCLG